MNELILVYVWDGNTVYVWDGNTDLPSIDACWLRNVDLLSAWWILQKYTRVQFFCADGASIVLNIYMYIYIYIYIYIHTHTHTYTNTS